MNNYFLVDDNHGGIYRIGVQGDIREIEAILRKHSRNVRYVGSKPEEKTKHGYSRKGRIFMGVKFVSCRYQYQLGVKDWTA